MKKRRWIILIAVILGLVFIAVFGFRFYGGPQFTEGVILGYLRPYLSNNAKIKSLRLTPNSLTLDDFTYLEPKSGIMVKIKKVRLNFKLFNLFWYGFSPQNLVEEVIINEWEIGTKSWKRISEPKLPPSGKETLPASFTEILKSLRSIQRIDFSRGRMIDYPVEGINGWLDLSTTDSAKLDLSANAFSDSANLRLNGLIFKDWESADLNLNLKLTDLPKEYEFSPGWRITGGKVELEVKGNIKEKRFFLNGQAGLYDLGLVCRDKYNLKKGQLRATFNEDTVSVSGRATFMGQDLSWKGRLENLTNPVFDLSLEAPKTDLSRVLQDINYSGQAGGMMGLKLNFKGNPKNPDLSFKASASELNFNQIQMKNALFSGKIDHQGINFNYFTFNAFGGKVGGEGMVSVADHKVNLNIRADYSGRLQIEELIPEIYQIPLDTVQIKAVIKGDADNPEISGSYTISPTANLRELKGEIDYLDGGWDLSQASGAGDTIKFHYDAQGGNPTFSLTGKNLQSILQPQVLPEWLHNPGFSTDIEAQGAIDNFRVKIKNRSARTDLILNGIFEKSEQLKFLSDLRVIMDDSLYSDGNLTLRMVGDSLWLDNLTFGPLFYAWGVVDLKQQKICNFQAEFNDFSLDTALMFAGMKNWRDYVGDVKLEVKAEGDLFNPRAQVSGYLSQGEFNGTPGYWGSLAGDLEDLKFRLLGLDFGNQDQPLFNCQGVINFDNGTIDLSSQTDNVDVGLLSKVLVKKSEILSGRGKFKIQGDGTLDNPQIHSEFEIDKGKLFKIPFDKTKGEIEFISGDVKRVYIKELKLAQEQEYEFSSSGMIPLEKEEMDLKFQGRGDLLSTLPFMAKNIASGSGKGRVEFGVGGSMKAPTLKSGSISLAGGSLRLNTVTDRIEDLNLLAELEGDFIHIQNLSGKIGGVPFTIMTVPSASFEAGKLEPWVINSLGLKLGIITLVTGEEGLRLNLPTFIAPGETALLVPSGRNGKEPAYIAGPEAHPLVRAKLLVRDGVITFPPTIKKKPPAKKNAFRELLERINWDLAVVPDRGNTYRREISGLSGSTFLKSVPGLFDRVAVDLSIDKQMEGLTIKGIIQDTTLTVDGSFVSTRGTINLLDFDFRVQEFRVEFDPNQKFPWVEGYATAVQKDTLGRDFTIELKAAHIDPETGEKTYRARWDDFTFVLEDEMGNSQEQILGLLGYTPETIGGKVTEVSMLAVDKAVFGGWLGSVEREIKGLLGVDYFQIDPALAQNLLEQNLLAVSPNDTGAVDWRTRYLRRSRFTIGKYITDDLFLTYAGKFESGESPYDRRQRLGMIHNWNLEYRLPTRGANLLMIMGLEYDSLERKTDRKISISYRFYF